MGRSWSKDGVSVCFETQDFPLLRKATLPETDSSPLEINGWTMKCPLWWPVFNGYVNVQGCITWKYSSLVSTINWHVSLGSQTCYVYLHRVYKLWRHPKCIVFVTYGFVCWMQQPIQQTLYDFNDLWSNFRPVFIGLPWLPLFFDCCNYNLLPFKVLLPLGHRYAVAGPPRDNICQGPFIKENNW